MSLKSVHPLDQQKGCWRLRAQAPPSAFHDIMSLIPPPYPPPRADQPSGFAHEETEAQRA